MIFNLFDAIGFPAGIYIWYTHVFASASQGSHVRSVYFYYGKRLFCLLCKISFKHFFSLDSIRNVWIYRIEGKKTSISLHVGFLTRFPCDPSFQMGPYISNIMLSRSYRTVPLGADINTPLCLLKVYPKNSWSFV